MAYVGDSSDVLRCSFCGKKQSQVRKLIAGGGVYICDECIEVCNEILEEELNDSTQTTTGNDLPTPKEICEFLDKYVVGQDDAKRVLAVAVLEHWVDVVLVKRMWRLQNPIFCSLAQLGAVRLI